jgi:hypothetical protein
MPPKKEAAVKAKHGEKMIEVSIRFWTNNIATTKDSIIPKNAWTAGVVRMERNETHGIIPKSPKVFGSLMDLSHVIEKVLIEHEIVLHPDVKMQKYLK